MQRAFVHFDLRCQASGVINFLQYLLGFRFTLTNEERRPAIARPVISSETPAEYASAVSMKLPPLSRNSCTMR